MFYNNQSKDSITKYKDSLKLIGSLSNIFSESDVPYLYYRVAEKLFNKAFSADDLSRSDVAIDSKFDRLGIGLKTFLRNNDKTFQKVAEFNKDKNLYDNLNIEQKIYKIATLRNERIKFAENLFNLDNSIYHCVIRDKGTFNIFEEKMDYIDLSKIKKIKSNKSSISFNDGKNDYSFLLSKSTLTKRFYVDKILESFNIDIIDDPLFHLEKLLKRSTILTLNQTNISETVYLPLYGKDFTVFSKSGLNQWNANGRKRDINEVYIPVPAILHKKFPNFFPNRDTPFDLILPNKKIMKSKICQDGGKALMSQSNRELGQWILRDVLNLKEGELLTYNKLQEIGIDSIRIDKTNNGEYKMNFSTNGSFEEFLTSL